MNSMVVLVPMLGRLILSSCTFERSTLFKGVIASLKVHAKKMPPVKGAFQKVDSGP